MKEWKGFMQGINLGGWLSQCIHTKEHYDSFINEKDLENISRWNIDHVRLPVDYNLIETKNGEYIEDGFVYIEHCIEWCRKYNLNMILDLHKTYGFSFDEGEGENGFFANEALQERFCRLWENFATRFGKDSDMLAFELLNEVTDRSYCEIWNDIADKCIARIRKIAPEIKILVGGYWNNAATAVKDLRKPYDENVIYNFHCYEPLVFTHQGAGWVKAMDRDFRCDSRCTEGKMKELTEKVFGAHFSPEGTFNDAYADEAFGKGFFVRMFTEAFEAAEKMGTMLYCGEYGVIEQADRNSAIHWYKAIHEAFREMGIGHAAWTYKKMDFDLNGHDMKCIFD